MKLKRAELRSVLYSYVCWMRAGAWFRRMMECPLCHELVFNGEWVSRRSDADNAASHDAAGRTEPCPICASAVPECLLVQPREKRTGVHLMQLRAQYLHSVCTVQRLRLCGSCLNFQCPDVVHRCSQWRRSASCERRCASALLRL